MIGQALVVSLDYKWSLSSLKETEYNEMKSHVSIFRNNTCLLEIVAMDTKMYTCMIINCYYFNQSDPSQICSEVA